MVGSFFAWKSVKDIHLVQIFHADILSDTLSSSAIGSHFVMLPTHVLAMQMLGWQYGEIGEVILYFFLLVILAVGAGALFFRVAALYYPVWQVMQERKSLPKNKSLASLGAYTFTGGRTQVLFKKELLISSRNLKGVLWFLFLSFIWLLQIGTSSIVGKNIDRFQPDIEQKIAILQSLQFIIAIYFISSFTLRFVFPSFSVEKKTSWILGSAPISIRKVFFGKHLFYSLVFVILGAVMSYVTTYVLKLSFEYALYALILLLVAIVFIVTFGISFGALFPSRDTDDPEVISTSMPGLFFTALALIYGAIGDYALYQMLTKKEFVYVNIFMIVSILVTVGILLTVPRKLTSQIG
jgi:hypothetical protein